MHQKVRWGFGPSQPPVVSVPARNMNSHIKERKLFHVERYQNVSVNLEFLTLIDLSKKSIFFQCCVKEMNDLFWNGYLAQVSDRRYTLENSASITRTDADAENRLSWKRLNVHILNIRKFMMWVFNESVIET